MGPTCMLVTMNNNPKYSRPSETPEAVSHPELNAALQAVADARHDFNDKRHKVTATEGEIRAADRDYAAMAAEAIEAGEPVPKDPRESATKRRERQVVEADVARETLRVKGEALDLALSRFGAEGLDLEREARQALLEEAIALGDRLDEVTREAAVYGARISWLSGGPLKSRPPAVKAVQAVRVELEEAAHPTPTYYLNSKQLRDLRAGQTVVDANGVTVTPEDAAAAHIKILHGKPLHVARTTFD